MRRPSSTLNLTLQVAALLRVGGDDTDAPASARIHDCEWRETPPAVAVPIGCADRVTSGQINDGGIIVDPSSVADVRVLSRSG